MYYYYVLLIIAFSFVSHILADEQQHESWTGNWFPTVPGATPPTLMTDIVMGMDDENCDNGIKNLQVDYDPKNISQHIVHLCTDDRNEYRSNFSVVPVMQEFLVPPMYMALHRCMNETIEYEERIPTFGTHRPLWPVYGEYSYVPVQRWLHNLEHGAIVMLYHPCADKSQIEALKKLVKKCLYRYVITPSDRLLPGFPFALVAWGARLEFSVVDEQMIIGFIRMKALRGPEKTPRDGQYKAGLLEKAEYVSSNDDALLCPSM